MKPTVTWVVCANSSHAEIYAKEGVGSPLRLLFELSHAQSRSKAGDLASDRCGNRRGSGSYAQRTPLKEREAESFASELAGALSRAAAERRFDRLSLAASSRFLGELQRELSPAARKALVASVPKDYTRQGAGPIAASLALAGAL